MAYSVNNTLGTEIALVLDGQTDSSSSSLVFIGKAVTNYGEIQNENFLWLLENFAGPTDPANPQEGQIWWDTANKLMKVYIQGVGWKNLSSFTASAGEPLNYYNGDQWWDTTNEQLKVWNGSEWILVGPVYSIVDGKTGALVENLYDAGDNKHTVTKFYTAGEVTAILNTDAEFVPNVAIDGFATVKPGLQISSNIANLKVHGTSTNSDSLGGVPAANYLRTDTDNTSTGNLRIEGSVFTVGNINQFAVGIGNDNSLSITHYSNNSSWSFKSNVDGVLTTVLAVDGINGLVSVPRVPEYGTGIANKNYVDSEVNNARSDFNFFLQANIDVARKNFEFTSNSARYQPTCYVSTDAPNNAVGNNGDFWFRYY